MHSLHQVQSRQNTDRVPSDGIQGVNFNVKDHLPNGTETNVISIPRGFKTKTDVTTDDTFQGKECNTDIKVLRTSFSAAPRLKADERRSRSWKDRKSSENPRLRNFPFTGQTTPKTVYYPTIVTHKPMSAHDERIRSKDRLDAKSPRNLADSATREPSVTSTARRHDDVIPPSAPIQPANFDVGNALDSPSTTVPLHISPKSDDALQDSQQIERCIEGTPCNNVTPRKNSMSTIVENEAHSLKDSLIQNRDVDSPGTVAATSKSEQGGRQNLTLTKDEGMVLKPIELTEEMSHVSFMEASRRNIAASLGTMSKARQRLDRSASVDYGRPSTVPTFPTISTAPANKPDVKSARKFANDEQGGNLGKSVTKTTRRRSQSVSDIRTGGDRRANRPARVMAWKPSETVPPRSQAVRAGMTVRKDVAMKEKNNSDLTGELPLLTGKHQYVHFEPGIVAFEGCDSANVYYNSLFRIVRRSVGSIYKHKKDPVNSDALLH